MEQESGMTKGIELTTDMENRTLEKDEAKQPRRCATSHRPGSPYHDRPSAARKTCNSRSRLEAKSARTTESDSKLTNELRDALICERNMKPPNEM